jgi:tRNA threonylcarbamoyladenosine biosynthesis protein TsaB
MLLAVDTSTRVIGVALYDGVRVLSELTWLSKNHHTVELAPTVKNACKSVGVEPSDIGSMGVAIGPGSFTGLRIGLAFAKGLALSRKIPIMGIPTLDILAASQPLQDVLLMCVIEAGRSRFAVGWYQNEGKLWTQEGEIKNLTTEALIESIKKPVRICGELTEDLIAQLEVLDTEVNIALPSESVRRPGVLAELAWKRFERNDYDEPSALRPIYLHQGPPIPG